MSNCLTLDRDALYIETQSLHQEGQYRWAILFVSVSGTTTRIQWPKPSPAASPRMPSTPRPSRPSTPLEHYMTVSVPSAVPPPLVQASRGAAHVLGYCKITAYAGGMPQHEFEAAGAAAVQIGDCSDGGRPRRPMWLFRLLGSLQESGYIVRGGSLAGLEEVVYRMNRDADMRCLQAFLHSKLYEAYLVAV